MPAKLRILVAAPLLALSAPLIVYVMGLRFKSESMRNAARRFHRGVGNPRHGEPKPRIPRNGAA